MADDASKDKPADDAAPPAPTPPAEAEPHFPPPVSRSRAPGPMSTPPAAPTPAAADASTDANASDAPGGAANANAASAGAGATDATSAGTDAAKAGPSADANGAGGPGGAAEASSAKSSSADEEPSEQAGLPSATDVKNADATATPDAKPGADAKGAADPKTAAEKSAPDANKVGAAAGAPGPLVRGKLAWAGAALSGCLYFVAFAGFDVWPLAFVALVPLYLVLIGQTPKRATWLGLLCGFAMNMGGFYWLANMLRQFSGFSTPLCVFFTSFICAYQGGRLAVLGWLTGRAAQRGWPQPIVFGAAFAASELVFPLLFPWYFAGAVHNVPVLMQLADVGGPILVSTMLVAVNIAIAEPLRARIAGAVRVTSSGAHEERGVAIDRRVVGAGVLALAVALVYGAVRMSMTNGRVAQAESARVGYVQGNMGLMQKRENPSVGLRRHLDLTSELKAKGADLVVWSETSATFPTREDLAMKQHFFREKFTAKLGVPTIFGAVLYRVDPDRERWFNTALGTDVKGEIKGRYDKQFLLAFGEYLPLGDTFPILYKWSPHSGRFSAGTSLDPIKMEVKGKERSIGVLICYEDVLPGFTNRAVAHADPELLVNMTNDAWFGNTTEPWEHLALAKFRAVEHRRFLVRSTNSGVSAVIDPNGKLVPGTVSTPFEAEAHDAEIRWLRGTTVYEILGDIPWYLVTFGIVIASFRRRKQAAVAA